MIHIYSSSPGEHDVRPVFFFFIICPCWIAQFLLSPHTSDTVAAGLEQPRVVHMPALCRPHCHSSILSLSLLHTSHNKGNWHKYNSSKQMAAVSGPQHMFMCSYTPQSSSFNRRSSTLCRINVHTPTCTSIRVQVHACTRQALTRFALFIFSWSHEVFPTDDLVPRPNIDFGIWLLSNFHKTSNYYLNNYFKDVTRPSRPPRSWNWLCKKIIAMKI